ncbi:hypothetical protein D3C80_1008860 [compost metagenome]
MLSGSLSGSLSLSRTLPLTGVSSTTAIGPSFTAMGASLSGVTMAKLSSAVSDRLPSLTVYVALGTAPV